MSLYYNTRNYSLEKVLIDKNTCYKPVDSVIILPSNDGNSYKVYFSSERKQKEIEVNVLTGNSLGFLLEKLGYGRIDYIVNRKVLDGKKCVDCEVIDGQRYEKGEECSMLSMQEKLTEKKTGKKSDIYHLFWLDYADPGALIEYQDSRSVVILDNVNSDYYAVNVDNRLHLVRYNVRTGEIEVTYYHPSKRDYDKWRKLDKKFKVDKGKHDSSMLHLFYHKNKVYIYRKPVDVVIVYSKDSVKADIIEIPMEIGYQIHEIFSLEDKIVLFLTTGEFHEYTGSGKKSGMRRMLIPTFPFPKTNGGVTIMPIATNGKYLIVYKNTKVLAFGDTPYERILYIHELGTGILGKWIEMDLSMDFSVRYIGYDETGLITGTKKPDFYLAEATLDDWSVGEQYYVYVLKPSDRKILGTDVILPDTLGKEIFTIRLDT